jgi:hypothetical protein
MFESESSLNDQSVKKQVKKQLFYAFRRKYFEKTEFKYLKNALLLSDRNGFLEFKYLCSSLNELLTVFL